MITKEMIEDAYNEGFISIGTPYWNDGKDTVLFGKPFIRENDRITKALDQLDLVLPEKLDERDIPERILKAILSLDADMQSAITQILHDGGFWDSKEAAEAINDWVKREYPDGYELDGSYDDDLSYDEALEICDGKTAEDRYNNFKDIMGNYYDEACSDARWELFNECIKALNITAYEERKDNQDFDSFSLDVKPPIDKYLGQDFHTVVTLQGKGEYLGSNCDMDNNWLNIDEWDDSLENTAVAVLIRSQGIEPKQAFYYLKERSADWYSDCSSENFAEEDCDKTVSEIKKNSFLDSLGEEMANCAPNDSNNMSVVLLTHMTLEDHIGYEKDKSILAEKRICCGLVDMVCGGGSCLGVNLLHNTVIPKENIYSVEIDSLVNKIYGLTHEAWTYGDVSMLDSDKECNFIDLSEAPSLIEDLASRQHMKGVKGLGTAVNNIFTKSDLKLMAERNTGSMEVRNESNESVYSTYSVGRMLNHCLKIAAEVKNDSIENDINIIKNILRDNSSRAYSR